MLAFCLLFQKVSIEIRIDNDSPLEKGEKVYRGGYGYPQALWIFTESFLSSILFFFLNLKRFFNYW